MGKVLVENIRVYAHHGCLPEETVIGSDYQVDVSLKANLDRAGQTDDLNDTVDYVQVNHIVEQEMATASKLLEHVAQRMISRMFAELPTVEKIKIKVSKINPPINGDVEKVTIVLKSKRTV